MSELIIGDGWYLPSIHYQAYICEGAVTPFSREGSLAKEQKENLENFLRYNGYKSLKVEHLDKEDRIYYRYRIYGDNRELVHFKLKFADYLNENERSKILHHIQRVAMSK